MDGSSYGSPLESGEIRECNDFTKFRSISAIRVYFSSFTAIRSTNFSTSQDVTIMSLSTHIVII